MMDHLIQFFHCVSVVKTETNRSFYQGFRQPYGGEHVALTAFPGGTGRACGDVDPILFQHMKKYLSFGPRKTDVEKVGADLFQILRSMTDSIRDLGLDPLPQIGPAFLNPMQIPIHSLLRQDHRLSEACDSRHILCS